MTQQRSKLTLHRETLLTLDNGDIGGVHGGTVAHLGGLVSGRIQPYSGIDLTVWRRTEQFRVEPLGVRTGVFTAGRIW